jgi:N-methylhydantoinase B
MTEVTLTDDAENGELLGGMDPVTFEVLQNAFTAIVDQMGVMLEKVSFSTVTTIGKDYACGLCTGNGEVFSRGVGGLPLFGGTIGHRVKAVVNHIPPANIRDGDVLLHNDPFVGGTHAQDVSAVMPVFWEGRMIAFVHAASHWPDLGGPVPGSFNAEARSSYAEGLLIPPIHLVREGIWDQEVEALILRNVRLREIIRGDLRGLVEACRTGRTELVRLLELYGVESILAAQQGTMHFSEQLLKREFAALPDGTYTWTDYIDRDPCGDPDAPLAITLELTITGDRAVYDFSRSAPQAIGPVNCPASSLQSACLSTTKATFPHISLNDGFHRAIAFEVPEGLVVSAAYPAPVSGHGSNAAEKIVSCVHGCYMQVVPERAMACPTNLVNIAISGYDPRPERQCEYVFYLWLCGGWGGRPGARDNGTYLTPLAAGTNLQAVESLEREYPVRFESFELLRDSEGAGTHRSGFGVRLPFVVTDGIATLSTLGDRDVFRPWAVDGGDEPPYGNGLVYARGTAQEANVGVMRANFAVEPGVLLDYWQCGGGGWGDPRERPAAWVLEDVRNGLVSPERADAVYGNPVGQRGKVEE